MIIKYECLNCNIEFDFSSVEQIIVIQLRKTAQRSDNCLLAASLVLNFISSSRLDNSQVKYSFNVDLAFR